MSECQLILMYLYQTYRILVHFDNLMWFHFIIMFCCAQYPCEVLNFVPMFATRVFSPFAVAGRMVYTVHGKLGTAYMQKGLAYIQKGL